MRWYDWISAGLLCLVVLAIIVAGGTALGQTLPNLDKAHGTLNNPNNYVRFNEIGDRIDQAVNDFETIAMSDADKSLSGLEQWDSGFIDFTGALTATRTIAST
jgi:hypothetical protein